MILPIGVCDNNMWPTGRNASESDYLFLWALIAYGVVHNRVVTVALHRTMDYVFDSYTFEITTISAGAREILSFGNDANYHSSVPTFRNLVLYDPY